MWQDIEPTRSLIFTECLQDKLTERDEDATKDAEKCSKRVDEQDPTARQGD